MKTIKSIACAVILMIAWGAAVFMVTLQGWSHTPIAKNRMPQSFIQAAKKAYTQPFVGNLAMATLHHGVVEYERFHTAGKPVDRNTVFQVASLSKWVSAFGVMKLVETGKLQLDTPVRRYLTRWQLPPGAFDNDGVTVRRLLSHTAGLTDGLGYSGFDAGTPVQSLEQSLTKAADADEGVTGSVQVGLKPGSQFRYSGGGYTLLQLLVEEVTGQTFAAYMKESVFKPLQMTHSTYVWVDHPSYALADFYHSDGTPASHRRYTALAAASLYTSLSDLELFFQTHLHGKHHEPIGRNVLHPETLSLMRTPHAQQMGFDIWGLGTVLFANTINHDFIIGHDSKSTPPVNTAIRLDPQTGDGIIILETGHPDLATRLASEWVFWKTGKVDTFLFPMLMGGMIRTMVIGWVVIVGVAISARVVGARRHYNDL